MGRHRMSKTMVFHVLLLVYGLGGNSLIGESAAQDVPRHALMEGQRKLTSKKPSLKKSTISWMISQKENMRSRKREQ